MVNESRQLLKAAPHGIQISRGSLDRDRPRCMNPILKKPLGLRVIAHIALLERPVPG
jgi:hypothetical protein